MDLLDELNQAESPNKGNIAGDLLDELESIQPKLAAEMTHQQAAPSPAYQPPEVRALAENVGPGEAALIGAGRGFTTIGRAVGLAEPEAPIVSEAMEALHRKRPVATTGGEIFGEAAPFLPAGVAVGAIRSLAVRIAAGTGLGAAEGLLIARGKGEDIETQLKGAGVGAGFAAAAEALFPVIGRIGNATVRRVTGRAARGALIDETGKPSVELIEALAKEGKTFEDLTNEAVEYLTQTKPGAVPGEAAAAAEFQGFGIPFTKGDIMRGPGRFEQQATEARLLESAADPMADPIRALRLKQSEGFKAQLDDLISKSGVPEDVGESIKTALSGQKKLLSSEKRELYKQAAELAPDVKNLPLSTQSISEAVPSASTLDDLAIIAPAQVESVEKLLVKYGINQEPELVEAYLKGTTRGKPNQITQLTVGNFDQFRKSLNAVAKTDQTGAASVLITPLKASLDAEADLIEGALRKGGVSDEAVLAPLKEARKKVTELKTEFSPDAITGRLIKTKTDGRSPVVEASRVYKELMAGDKAPELIERTVKVLKKAPGGKKALGNLQAATIADLLENAFKSETRKIGDIKTFGAVAYTKRLNQIGDRKLNALFPKSVVKKLRQVESLATKITPPSGAVPKGSASVILDQLNKLGITAISTKIPGVTPFIEVVRRASENAGNRAALNRAINAKPAVKEMATFIANDLPGLAAPLGIAYMAGEE